MSDNKQALNDDQLEQVSGGVGNGSYDYLHDPKNFVTMTVCNVIHYDATACLTLRKSPNGEIIYGIGWQNGDKIEVHKDYKPEGWYFAKKGNTYGYVNPNNVK